MASDIKIERIIRTKRKTIALQITDEATLVVKAPLHLKDDAIIEVVKRHRRWIEKKKREIKSREPRFSKKEFVNGEGFLYLGRHYKLTIIDNQESPLIFENGFFLSKDVLPKARQVFINWYKKAAHEKIMERVKFYAQKRGFIYDRVKITNAEKRWGSCARKNLNFSWRLIMAPLPVIDYVVVHELVHIEERNHSKKFWSKVKLLMPDYEKYKDWLKEKGYILRL